MTYTYLQIVELVQALATAHPQIHSFGFGDYRQIQSSGNIQPVYGSDAPFDSNPVYPLLFMVPDRNKIPYSVNTTNIQYFFTLYCSDIVQKDDSNLVDVTSDTDRILRDIASQLKTLVDGIDILSDIDMVWFPADKYPDGVAGWSMRFALAVPAPFDACDIPGSPFLIPVPCGNCTEWTGFSGYSGFSGFSGGTGSNGSSGYSGYSGAQGAAGAGTSGYSGQAGSAGTSGFSGYSGGTGAAGASGFSGYSGSGRSGYSGYSGVSGFSGSNASGWALSGNSISSGQFLGTNNAQDLSLRVNGIDRIHVYDGGGIHLNNLSGTGTGIVLDSDITLINSNGGPSTVLLQYGSQLFFYGFAGSAIGFGANNPASEYIINLPDNPGNAGDVVSVLSAGGLPNVVQLQFSAPASFSGYSGYSGSNGSVGTSGYSGYSGYSGSNGSNGSSGLSGYSGYSGSNGSSGTSGFSGYSGRSGYSGYSGASGYSGYSGSNGSTGTSGFSGYSGYSGTNGSAGTSGFSGYSGYSGFSGYSGYSGAVGTVGVPFGAQYQFSTSTTNSDPGNGIMRFNSGTIASVTQVYIDNQDVAALDQTGWFASFNNASATTKGYFSLMFGSNLKSMWQVTSAAAQTGYYLLNVTFVSGTLNSNGQTVYVSFSQAGSSGYSGYSGVSGYSGFSGYSGVSGFSGYSGAAVASLKYNHTIFTPTTGGSITLTNNNYNIVNPAGALLALTINLPSSPANNDVVYIKFTQAVTTVTYAGGTIQDSLVAPAAGGLSVLCYDSGTSIWY